MYLSVRSSVSFKYMSGGVEWQEVGSVKEGRERSWRSLCSGTKIDPQRNKMPLKARFRDGELGMWAQALWPQALLLQVRGRLGSCSIQSSLYIPSSVSDQLKRVRLRHPPLRNSGLWSEGRESTRLPAIQSPRSSVLRPGLMRTLGLARIWLCRRPHRDTEAGHVFLMESNPRGLCIFFF